MNIRWVVDLNEEERTLLNDLTRGGTCRTRKTKRALILLRSDEGWSAEEIAAALDIGTSTVYRCREYYVEMGLPTALDERKRPGAQRKLDVLQEATLVALACSKAPKGASKWTMQMLADQLVVLTDVEDLSDETVRRRLVEKKIKPWQHKMWCIPSVDTEFVARMEDVLDLYSEPYDPRFPVVNFDETPVQLIGETRVPIRATSYHSARIDYEYRRNGTANLFVAFDRHRSWRNVNVTHRRTLDDFAEQMRELVDVHYPDAERIRVVLDNLNTHRLAALYGRFEPHEARRIAKRLEFHFTPKHASWLNMVEIEIGVLTQQCLDRRIPSIEVLTDEIHAWQETRNTDEKGIDWLFDVAGARHKLRRLYPVPTSRQLSTSQPPKTQEALPEVERKTAFQPPKTHEALPKTASLMAENPSRLNSLWKALKNGLPEYLARNQTQ